jgi:hypothetical protein
MSGVGASEPIIRADGETLVVFEKGGPLAVYLRRPLNSNVSNE